MIADGPGRIIRKIAMSPTRAEEPPLFDHFGFIIARGAGVDMWKP